jgi:hypothetical protein
MPLSGLRLLLRGRKAKESGGRQGKGWRRWVLGWLGLHGISTATPAGRVYGRAVFSQPQGDEAFAGREVTHQKCKE